MKNVSIDLVHLRCAGPSRLDEVDADVDVDVDVGADARGALAKSVDQVWGFHMNMDWGDLLYRVQPCGVRIAGSLSLEQNLPREGC